MASLFDSLSGSFTSKTVVGSGKLPLSTFNFKSSSDAKLPFGFGPEAFTLPIGTVNTGQNPAWTFITAPEDVSWDIANQSERVNIFGTNSPPVVAGTKGMRDLSLNNSLVEGFIRGVNVEAKVASLEKLMEYSPNLSDGFVNVPVYQVWASNKSYGGSNAYYIIKDVKVKETMRDLKGNATRAYVDISLLQVPEYQVNTGRDLASATTAGVRSGLLSRNQTRNAATAAVAAAARGNQDVGTTKGKEGATGPTSSKQPTAQSPTTGRIRGVSRTPPPTP